MPESLTQVEAIRERKHEALVHDLTARIRSVVEAEPTLFLAGDRVYLFGSHATGHWDGLSDVDLFVVLEKLAEARDHDAVYSALARIADDVIVVQEATYERHVRMSHPFWTRVDGEKQLLWEVA